MSGIGSNLLILGIGYLIWVTLWFIRKVSRGEIDWTKW